MTYTPGPWFWPYDNTLAGGDPDGNWTLIAAIHDAGPVSEANARLIAAAPELLELVNFVLACEGNDYAVDDQWVARAEAAIAKAEGRQP